MKEISVQIFNLFSRATHRVYLIITIGGMFSRFQVMRPLRSLRMLQYGAFVFLSVPKGSFFSFFSQKISGRIRIFVVVLHEHNLFNYRIVIAQDRCQS